MYEPDVTILLMYGSHDMRHTGFRRFTKVNGTLGGRGVTVLSVQETRNLSLKVELMH